MPYKSEGRKNYPNVKYDPPEATADPVWMAKRARSSATNRQGQIPLADVPRAEVVELQSADEFSAFTPMELIATAAGNEGPPRGPSRCAAISSSPRTGPSPSA